MEKVGNPVSFKTLPSHKNKSRHISTGTIREVLHPCSCHMYVYTCTWNTAKGQTFGQPTLPVIRYIEYSSLSRDSINQKMKVGQIINILPGQSNYILWKCLTTRNQTMGTKETRKHLVWLVVFLCISASTQFKNIFKINQKEVDEIFFQIIQSLKIHRNLLTRSLKLVTLNLNQTIK